MNASSLLRSWTNRMTRGTVPIERLSARRPKFRPRLELLEDRTLLSAVVFSAPVNYGTDTRPVSATVANLRHDGRLDLVTANQNSDTISVLLGNGDGTFQPAVNYTVGSVPSNVAVGDFNGDGNLDLAVANSHSGTVSVLLGNGDGTLQPQQTFAAGLGPFGVLVRDFNGDGKLDLAASGQAGTVSMLLGLGSGSFAPATPVAVGHLNNGIAAGDFNGDGKLDLAVSDFNSNTVNLLLGDGNGGFSPSRAFTVGSGPHNLAAGDFNGDGKLDLAVANVNGNTVTVLLGDGNGGFNSITDYSVDPNPRGLAVADLNGDGRLDLVTANQSGGGTVLLGNGDGTFHPGNLIAGPAAADVVAADFNGDGQTDLALADFLSGGVNVLLNSSTPASLSGIVWEDFNGDGNVDFGERGIQGANVALTGADDIGNAVNLSETTDADGAYIFLNLRPGNYRITETQPAGYLQGIDTVGTAGGSLVDTDTFSIPLSAGVNGLNYNFGEQPTVAGPVQKGQAAGIGFWNNKNGQALIKVLPVVTNSDGTVTDIANWLANTMPNTFSSLTGKSNADVAALFQQDFVLKGVKLDAQVLATALNVYATNATLDSTGAAVQYGFTLSGDGLGADGVNVGNDGAAFGVANSTSMSVIDLLKATDAQSVAGVLYGGNTSKRNLANDLFSAINQAGGL